MIRHTSAEPARGTISAASAPQRPVMDAVTPEIDAGRYAIKRVAGETVTVTADIFAEGHDVLAAVLLHRRADDGAWRETVMRVLGDDRWEATFPVPEVGRYEYTIEAWVDHFASWRAGLVKKVDAAHEVSSELLEGAGLVREAAARARGSDAAWLRQQADALAAATDLSDRIARALAADLAAAMSRHPDRTRAARYARVLRVEVERERARFGAWYEMFPRSCAPEPGRHGTFKDCAARIAYAAGMGFDVLYLPPIHPIGVTHRKGKRNAPMPGPDDVGSPWAIGAPEGGHTAVHPQLGTLDDFDRLMAAARQHGMEIALDLAFQCSPDHPWVQSHPQWFRWRPDGTVQYAENPPKKYQDIYPLYFESEQWRSLWEELKQVVLFWIARGVRIFRVDNPHTKPFAFWEWLIAEVREHHPDVIFLSEAFTRPKVLRQLAKLGFSQSYTYFTWRNSKTELTEYFTELMESGVREYLRPNLFTNTPDILPEYLQVGGRAGFMIRLVLAATLGASYGIYGPAFELCEATAAPGSEEYLQSEKYELRSWDTERPDSLRDFIARVNQIRRENPALQTDASLRFLPVDNPQVIFYAKVSADRTNCILVAVNLDPHHAQTGWVTLPVDDLGLEPRQPYQVHELLSDARYLWQGARNYVALDPQVVPAHIFRVRRRVRTERDFDYYL